MSECDCKICKRSREEQGFLKQIRDSTVREFVLDLMQYRDSLETELNREKAIADGSWPGSVRIKEERMKKVKARNGN